MENISFVTSEELMQPQYEEFHLLTGLDKEHPLHRFYDYILQFFGGIREDVLLFFCESGNIKQLAELVEAPKDVSLRNEWYRRFIRLLQCNAEKEWYQMFFLSGDKSSGYIQYFFNQLPTYAESGVSSEEVKQLFLENNAAYLLEYQIRGLLKKEGRKEEVQDGIPTESIQKPQEKETPENLDYLQKLMEPVLESQKNIQTMLQCILSQKNASEELLQNSIPTAEKNMEDVISDNFTENMEDVVSDNFPEDMQKMGSAIIPEKQEEAKGQLQTELLETEQPETEYSETAEEKEPEKIYRTEKENALRFARLFQQIRIKRKKVQLRKLDRTRQLQELVTLMQKEDFSMEEMKLVRSLIEHEISLEFLYVVIAEEQEAKTKLKQMCEFLEQQKEKEERQVKDNVSE